MAIVINGSTNVISGVAVGGLPDGIVDTDMLAANAVTSAKIVSGAGGKILQHKSAFKTDMSSHTGDTFGAISGLSISLAKTAASNKLLVFANINGGRDGTIWIQFKLFQDASEITALNNSGGGSYASFINWYSDNSNGNHGAADNANINGAALFDGANDTSSHTYQIYGSTRTSGRVMYVNRRGQNTDYSGTSCLTIFEVAS